MEQINIFDLMYEQYKITKPIRLIELFGGIGSQAKALENLKAQGKLPMGFEHYRLVEFDKYPVASYNAIHGTNFETMDITKIHATDLGICDRDKFEYIMTYSFPCQDLSLAGLGKGMKKDSGTRSGLLWEVERLIKECGDELPQILLMENVPQVIGEKNIDDFNEWRSFLSSKGYSNFMQILNAKDYGIPQNRNRCFMVSILGDWSYHFPTPIKLKYKLKDFLEKTVDEKYYLSGKQIEDIKSWNAHEKPLEKMEQTEKSVICPTITTRTGDYTSSMILVKTKDTQSMKQELCDNLIQSGKVKENDVIRHNYTTSKNGDCIQGNNEMPTLDTRCDCLGVVVNDVEKIEYTEKGIVKQNIIPFGSYYTWKDNQGNINTQCNRAANEENYALTIACAETGKVAIKHPSNSILRIRKLTPKECFRLMGVKDCDSKNIKQSDASEFHLAGDSIVSSVLMGIFGELLGIDYKTKIEELVEEIVK